MANRRKNRRQEIVAATVRLVARQGVTGASIRQIASEAGVTEGALYRHFENKDDLCQQAGKLGVLGIPLFIFQEGKDPGVAAIFRQMANLTGGAYAPFDLSSASQLKNLLSAVAIYAAGGHRALQDLGKRSHPEIDHLLRQLKD